MEPSKALGAQRHEGFIGGVVVAGGVRVVGEVTPCPIMTSAWTSQMIRLSDVVGGGQGGCYGLGWWDLYSDLVLTCYLPPASPLSFVH